MQQEVESRPECYAASIKLRHKILSHVGNISQWTGAFYAASSYGWKALPPYIIIMFIFTYFLGIPPFINAIRCAEAYKGMNGSFAVTLFIQGLLACAMLFLLARTGLWDMTPFFVVLASIRSLSMPREQLMQERYEINLKRAGRGDRFNESLRSAPDGRAEAPKFWRETPFSVDESERVARSMGASDEELKAAREYADEKTRKMEAFINSNRSPEEINKRLRENAELLRSGTPHSRLNWD
jgi:hypothetical protein